MATVVNLRMARKAKARSAKESAAAENRVKFGRTKVERDLNEARAAKSVAALDGHKLSGDRPDER